MMSWMKIVLLIYFFPIGMNQASESAESDRDSQIYENSPPSHESKVENLDSAMIEKGNQLNKDEGESLTVLISQKEDQEAVKDPFIATDEWQKIKPGQTIPRGLHVRMNLQTGEKEAKLLEQENSQEDESVDTQLAALIPQDEESNSEFGIEKMLRMKKAIEDAMTDLEREQQDSLKHWKDSEKEGMMNVNKKEFSRDELKEALKKFKAIRDDVQDESVTKKSIKQRFKDIDTLKKEFEELMLNVKTDYEIITDLYNKYQNKELGVEERKNLLTDLEFYLHQIDNAKDFSKMGGLSLVIKDLNHTEESVRSEAAFVIGSATQSNPQVQIQAIESGALQQLIRMIAGPLTSVKLGNRVVYAISSIIRHFPYAQQRFIQLGGFSALSTLFTQDSNEKLQLKCITLITDLVLEQKFTTLENDEKVIQYKKVQLITTLQELGWCDFITRLLSSTDHDSREKVLAAMGCLMNHCKPSFSNSLSQLNKLKSEYEDLAKEELSEDQENQYYTGLLHSVNSLLSDLKLKDEL